MQHYDKKERGEGRGVASALPSYSGLPGPKQIKDPNCFLNRIALIFNNGKEILEI